MGFTRNDALRPRANARHRIEPELFVAMKSLRELHAVEIRMRATRRLGEMMEKQPKNEGGRPSKNRVIEKPSLADAGIDKNLAHQARSLA